MSTPLDAARALFGDAMADRKLLRRAYARLIRQHPPDSDPERFQEIRAAYELALEHLDNPERALEAGDTSVADGVAALTPETFDATLARLAEQANADPDAGHTALFLVQATRPDGVLEWLVERRTAGLADGALIYMLAALLDVRPTLARSSTLDALVAGVAPGEVVRLEAYRARAFIRDDALEEGFALWRTCEGGLRATLAQVWCYVADAILFFAAERAPDDVLATIEVALEDVQLGLGEIEHADLSESLLRARALRALAADPSIPDSMPVALRLGQRTAPIGAFSAARQCRFALEDHGDGDLDRGVLRLSLAHPTAYRILRGIELDMTDRYRFENGWIDQSVPPESLPDELSALIGDVVTPRPERLTRGHAWGISMVVGAALALVAHMVDAGWVLATLIGGIATWTLDEWLQARFGRPEPPSLPEIADRFDSLQRTYGLWRHELAAGLVHAGVEVPMEVWQHLGDDQNADLRCLSASHGYRVSVPPDAPDDDGAPAGAETGEEADEQPA